MANHSPTKQKPRILNSMQEQEIAFRSFLSSLKKCPNKQSILSENPEQKHIHQVASKSKQKINQSSSSKKKISNTLIDEEKNLTSQNSKRSVIMAPTNFRINIVKSNEKQTPLSRANQIEQSLIKASRRKISQTKQSSTRKFHEVQVKSQLNPLSQRYSSSNKAQSNFKRLQFSNEINQVIQNPMSERFQQTSNKLNQTKLKLQKTQSVAWNPDSHSFLTKIYNQKFSQMSSALESSFLIEVLNMETTSMVNFLKQQEDAMLNLGQIEGKQIYDLFKQIFHINMFTPINQPLIKKYNNCIFYGENPNFDSVHAGIIMYFNGNVYLGALKNFQKHGLGIDFVNAKNLSDKIYKAPYSYLEKQEYVIFRGNFFKNSKSGQFLINAKDYVFQGNLMKGFFEGTGTLVTKSSTFKGTWTLNKKVSGTQDFRHPPAFFQGEYFEGVFHGKGKLKSLEQFYQGQFQNGKKHGKGILVNKEYIFEGSFEHDRKHGSGIIFNKSEYKQQNPESEQNNLFDFQSSVYKVEFMRDKLISKVELNQDETSLKNSERQSLKTLEEQKSVYESVTVDFQNIRPSKMLNSFARQKLPTKRPNLNITLTPQSKNYLQHLQVLPRQPQEQILGNIKKGSFLSGNKFNRPKNKTRKEQY